MVVFVIYYVLSQFDDFTNLFFLFLVPKISFGCVFGIGFTVGGLTDVIIVIGAWKKINWMIYLWIGLTHAQSVLICAFFAQLYWPVAICLVYMAIISLFGLKLLQNIAVDNDYSEMTNLTNNEEV